MYEALPLKERQEEAKLFDLADLYDEVRDAMTNSNASNAYRCRTVAPALNRMYVQHDQMYPFVCAAQHKQACIKSECIVLFSKLVDCRRQGVAQMLDDAGDAHHLRKNLK